MVVRARFEAFAATRARSLLLGRLRAAHCQI